MEWRIDILNIEAKKNARQGNLEPLHELFDTIEVYWDVIRSCGWNIVREEGDILENEVIVLYNAWIKDSPKFFPTELFASMRKFKRWIFDTKQLRMRLGIPMRVEKTTTQKLEAAFLQ